MKSLLDIIKKQNIVVTILFSLTALFSLTVVTIYIVSYMLGPPSLTNDQNTVYYNDDGDVFGEESGAESRYWIDLDDMSDHFIDATIAVEDRHFYSHHGFDFGRIISAAITDIKSRSLKEGASTLTQQYARNLFLTPEKTWHRKIKEAFYTVRMEMFYDKDDILEGYLNTIYFGHGSYGIEAASRYFFDKHAEQLTIAEAAMLAGIPKGPSYYSPLNDEERAKSRQKQILKLLRDDQKISEQQYETAISEDLRYAQAKKDKEQSMSAYFQDKALQEAASILELEEETIKSDGYKIYTTLNTTKQKELTDQIDEEMENENDLQVGSLAMDPNTGAIKAMIGGRNYNESSFNRSIKAKRMAGSAFKPFLYYAAIDHNYTPSTKLRSEPTTFELENGDYKLNNFNNYYAHEPITLAQALALSDNIYAVKTHLFLGEDELVQTAKKFGISESLPAVPSLALGTASVTIDEMVTGYSMLANGGHTIEGYTVQKIIDKEGQVIFERDEQPGEQVLDEQSAFILTDLMTGMFDPSLNGYMDVTGTPIIDQLSRTYAGKSGSTDYDSWMIGYSESLTTAVWIGYDDHRSLNHQDHSHAKNIWAQFMEAVHDDGDEDSFSEPNGLVRVPIDPESGQIATPYCPTSRMMYFKEGTEPQEHCTTHFPADEDEEDPIEHLEQEKQKEKGFFERVFDLFFN